MRNYKYTLAMLPRLALLSLLIMPVGVWAQNGVTNSMEMAISDHVNAPASIASCLSGYYLVKKGDHDMGFSVHLRCAEAGYTRSMIWLAYMYQNSYLGKEQPDMAAYWDRRSAEAGNEVGMYNFGLDLLRGYGVARDEQQGKYWVDRAAALGHTRSLELQQAGYDLSTITPDSDEAKYD